MRQMQPLIDFYYRYKKGWGCFGNYPTWAAALQDCEGYDSAQIINKVRAAVLKVKNGKAKYERDSVLFYNEMKDENLLNFLKNASQNSKITEGDIRVLDFGGSLGSTYFQHKKEFEKYPNLIWCVVEQGHFVDIGRKDFEDEVLKFEYSVSEAIAHYKPNVLILASVLQYLEKPYEMLKMLFDTKIPYIYIDKTPFLPQNEDRIIKQIVHPKVYNGSYPTWLFSKKKFQNFILPYANIESSFTNTDRNNILNCRYEGYFLKLK
jgi:putative methyltransferase (TIGR04325 family)